MKKFCKNKLFRSNALKTIHTSLPINKLLWTLSLRHLKKMYISKQKVKQNRPFLDGKMWKYSNCSLLINVTGAVWIMAILLVSIVLCCNLLKPRCLSAISPSKILKLRLKIWKLDGLLLKVRCNMHLGFLLLRHLGVGFKVLMKFSIRVNTSWPVLARQDKVILYTLMWMGIKLMLCLDKKGRGLRTRKLYLLIGQLLVRSKPCPLYSLFHWI